MTIESNLQRLISVKNNIASAIVSMGGSVGANDGLEAFPQAIQALPSGGGVEVDEDDLALMEQMIGGSFSSSVVMLNASRVGDYVFARNNKIVEANFPYCLEIGSHAFEFCSSLQQVSFPNCSIIGIAAFESCTSLQSVSIPNCNTITNYAFAHCTSLTSVSFPNCSTIGQAAFQLCTSLQSVYLLSTSVCTLSNSTAFWQTPLSQSSYLGYFGSIYVPSSLLTAYKTATNWIYYSSRFVGV